MRKWPIALLILVVISSGCLGKTATVSLYIKDNSPGNYVSIRYIEISKDGKIWTRLVDNRSILLNSTPNMIAQKNLEEGNYSYLKLYINSIKDKEGNEFIISRHEIEFNRNIQLKNNTKIFLIFNSEKSIISVNGKKIYQPIIGISVI